MTFPMITSNDVMRRSRAWCVGAAVLPLLTACASLPSSGPTARQLTAAPASGAVPYRIVELNAPEAAGGVEQVPTTTGLRALETASPPQKPDEIFVGDGLDITVFEVGASLFTGLRPSLDVSGGQAPTASGQVLPRLRVAEDGTVAMPYLGVMPAAGLTVQQFQAKIEKALRGRSQSPQVVVVIGDDVGDTVTVMGDVKSPGRRPLTAAHERVLDILAISGGPAGAKADTLVRLTRGDQWAEAPLGDLTAASPDNVRLRPQDRLELILKPRTFTAFGASGRVSEVSFQASQITLAEAIARVGGPLDQQADPAAVFVFRAARDPGAPSTIYRLNLNDASGYFVAQRFVMRDKDLIYIANARTNSLSKALSILSSIVTPIVTAKTLSR